MAERVAVVEDWEVEAERMGVKLVVGIGADVTEF